MSEPVKKPTAKPDPPEEDPYKDWTDEEKAEWDAGAKFEERHANETASAIFERLFAEPEGGSVIDPEEEGEKPPTPAPSKGGAIPSSGAAWFDRPLFSRRQTPAEK